MGAALGGFMAEHLGWRWEFGVQVPPLVISITVAYMTIPGDLGLRSSRKSLRQTIRDFDSLGAVILTVFITFMILGLNLGGNELPCKSTQALRSP
jgi:predicted MFS family arabinose efflux permease